MFDGGYIISGLSADGTVAIGWQSTRALGDTSLCRPARSARTGTFISDDGNVVYGYAADGQSIYIGRVVVPGDAPGGASGGAGGAGGAGSGAIDLQAFQRSLTDAQRLTTSGLAAADLVMNNAHSSPVRGLPAPGQTSLWMTGDTRWRGTGNRKPRPSRALASMPPARGAR